MASTNILRSYQYYVLSEVANYSNQSKCFHSLFLQLI